MCICVDCRWVDRCKTYHSVERQHRVAHLTETPDWEPLRPRIHISLRDFSGRGLGVEWDVRSCESFLKDSGRWQRLCPDQELPK